MERPVCRGRAMPNGPWLVCWRRQLVKNVTIVRTRAHVARVFGGRGVSCPRVLPFPLGELRERAPADRGNGRTLVRPVLSSFTNIQD